MAWESDNEAELEKTGRDWTRMAWYGLAVLVVGMLIYLAFPEDKIMAGKTKARVAHILIGFEPNDIPAGQVALALVTELQERIANGESFAKIAREYSTDEESAPRGGDLNWVMREELNESIDEYVWVAPLNQVSQPIQTRHGFHLVIVIDREFADAERYERELHDRVLEDSLTPQQP